jgi:hypothetical protein
MMRETLLDIAHSGVLAPSADNEHVFQIELTEATIRLWPTSDFTLTTERLRRVLGLISLGAVVENMRLRAGELGLIAVTTWFPVESSGPIAEMRFQPVPAALGDELAAAIPQRHTNRRMYRGPGLSVVETALLNTSVAPVEGVQLIWLRGAARRRALGLIWRAESERFLRQRLHQDLFSSIRFDLSWRETADRALPPGALEIETPMRPLFKALRHWALMRPLTWIGVHRLIGLRAGWLPAWQAPALGLIATSLPVEQGAVAVGAALERLWLRASLLELALQPMAASAVLPLQSAADRGASDELRAALAADWQTIAPDVTPLMVFRMGRAGRPTVRSGRRPLDDYLFTPPLISDCRP